MDLARPHLNSHFDNARGSRIECYGRKDENDGEFGDALMGMWTPGYARKRLTSSLRMLAHGR